MRKDFYKNIQNQVFHKTCQVLGPIDSSMFGTKRKTVWLFRCLVNGPGCKGEFESILPDVRNGNKKSCGCIRREDISGKIYYDSTGNPTCQALWYLNNDVKGTKWLFRCLINGPGCKGTFITTVGSVNRRTKPTRSCGCYNRKCSIERHTTHGMSRTSEYRTYINLNQRCTNSNNPGYKNYGGRGISNEYNSFEIFYNHMGSKANPDDTIERIDNDLGYSSNNNNWENRTIQAWNRRSNKIQSVEEAEFIRDIYFNRNVSIKNIAEFFRCSYSTIDFIVNRRTWIKTG